MVGKQCSSASNYNTSKFVYRYRILATTRDVVQATEDPFASIQLAYPAHRCRPTVNDMQTKLRIPFSLSDTQSLRSFGVSPMPHSTPSCFIWL